MSSSVQTVQYFQILQKLSQYQYNNGKGSLPPLPEEVAQAMNNELRAKEQCCYGCCICWSCCPPGQKIIDENFQRIKEFYEELGISLAYNFAYCQEIARKTDDAEALIILTECQSIASKIYKNKFIKDLNTVFSIYISNVKDRESLFNNLINAAKYITYANAEVRQGTIPAVANAVQQAHAFAIRNLKHHSSENNAKKDIDDETRTAEEKQEKEELPVEPAADKLNVINTDTGFNALPTGKETATCKENDDEIPEEPLTPKAATYREVKPVEIPERQDDVEKNKTTDLSLPDKQQTHPVTMRKTGISLAQAPKPIVLPGQTDTSGNNS